MIKPKEEEDKRYLKIRRQLFEKCAVVKEA